MSNKTNRYISLYVAMFGSNIIGSALERAKITGVYDVHTLIAFVFGAAAFAVSGIITEYCD